MYEQIRYDVVDPVATLSLHRPERLNAWTGRMSHEVRHALAAAERDPRVVGIVLTGSGRGFCSGADLRETQAPGSGIFGEPPTDPALAASPGDPESVGQRAAYAYLLSIRKPILAAVNGPCAGMAVAIALYADVRFASDRALFTTAFVQRGLIAEWGLSWMLSRLAGPAVAMDLLLSGRKLDAAEAERLGLVNRVVPHDDLLDEARRYLVALAEHCSPASMAVIKRQVYEDLMEGLGRAERKSVRLMHESFTRPDFQEGVQAFLQRRAPKFRRLGEEPG